MANFATALNDMRRGHKVGRKHWEGYWCIEDGEVMIHTRDGKVLNIKETDDIMYTLGNVSCDDWEIKDKY